MSCDLASDNAMKIEWKYNGTAEAICCFRLAYFSDWNIDGRRGGTQ